MDARADVGRVEKAEPGQVREHPIMGLGQQGGEDGGPPMGRMGEGQLVAQRGLAGARGTGDQVGAAHRQAAAQDLIEPRDAGRVLGQDGWSAGLRVACDLRRSGSCHLVLSPCPRALAPALHALGEDALACSMPRGS